MTVQRARDAERVENAAELECVRQRHEKNLAHEVEDISLGTKESVAGKLGSRVRVGTLMNEHSRKRDARSGAGGAYGSRGLDEEA